jgi:hypothetical protein
MYLGIDKCISYSFSEILILLTDQGENINRTNIIINLARKFIRLFKLLNIESNTDLENIYPIQDFKFFINKLDDTGLFWLGDTLFHLITDNCDIIVEELIKNSKKDSSLVVRLNNKFVTDLTIGSFSLLQ